MEALTDVTFVEVEEARIEYARLLPSVRLLGAAPPAPIVFLHHGFGCVQDWGSFPRQLVDAARRPGLVYSRRGCGRSSPLAGARNETYLHDEAQFLFQLLDRLELGPCHFYGHSDGATIALLFAAQYHDRALSSVIEAPHVFAETVTIEGVATLTERYQRDATLQSKLARIHTDPDGAFYAWSTPWLSSQFRTWSIADQLSRLRSPLLVIQGANDPFGSIAHAELIAGAAEKYTTVAELPGCGHNPHREEPATTIQLAAEFLMHDH